MSILLFLLFDALFMDVVWAFFDNDAFLTLYDLDAFFKEVLDAPFCIDALLKDELLISFDRGELRTDVFIAVIGASICLDALLKDEMLTPFDRGELRTDVFIAVIGGSICLDALLRDELLTPFDRGELRTDVFIAVIGVSICFDTVRRMLGSITTFIMLGGIWLFVVYIKLVCTISGFSMHFFRA